VARIDRRSGTVDEPIPVGGQPKRLAVGGDSVWVANCSAGTVIRIRREQGFPQSSYALSGQPGSVAVGGGRVYVAVRHDYPVCESAPRDRGPGRIAVLDPGATEFRTLRKIEDPIDVALTDDWLWVADRTGERRNRVWRVDPRTGDINREPLRVDPKLTSIAADDHDVWALSRNGVGGTVTRINPETMKPVGNPIDVDGGAQEIAVGAGRVWVTQAKAGAVSPIQP
jgi:DNA-binding beta-propeller fold protein YncE